MKRKAAIVTFLLGIGLNPAMALAAENAESGGGSWLALVIYTINFCIFLLICRHYGRPLVRKFFGNRSGTIRETLDRARGALAEAEALSRRAAERLAQLAAEKSKLAGDLEAETAFQVKQLRDNAIATVERIRRDAELTAAAVIEGARRRLRERLAAVAAELARDLVRRDFTADDQGRLLQNFSNRLAAEARG